MQKMSITIDSGLGGTSRVVVNGRMYSLIPSLQDAPNLPYAELIEGRGLTLILSHNILRALHKLTGRQFCDGACYCARRL